jgi:hypothetical protein
MSEKAAERAQDDGTGGSVPKEKRERRRGRFSWRLLLLGAIVLLAGTWGVLSWIRSCQETRIDELETQVAALTEDYVPIRFKILSRGADRLSVRVRFYDRDGTELSSMEESFAGSELTFDFLVARNAEGTAWYSFPYKLYTDATAPKSGVDLFKYYDQQGFPGVFGEKGMAGGQREAYSKLFAAVRAGQDPGSGFFGNAVHDIKAFSLFEVDLVYRIVCRAKGGIEIMEE